MGWGRSLFIESSYEIYVVELKTEKVIYVQKTSAHINNSRGLAVTTVTAKRISHTCQLKHIKIGEIYRKTEALVL